MPRLLISVAMNRIALLVQILRYCIFLLFIRFILFGITIGSASGTSVKSCLTLREMMLCCVQSVELKSKVSF